MRRGLLSPARRAAASSMAAERARSLLGAFAGRVVAGYWPIRSEADPRPMLDIAAALGAALALPIPTDDGLLFRQWNSGAPLADAGFGTLGPPPEAPRTIPHLLIMPLAAFDRQMNRIGYGKGHYDRAIAALAARGERPRLLGLAFALQEVEKVPFEPHDIRLDAIVTEDELIGTLDR